MQVVVSISKSEINAVIDDMVNEFHSSEQYEKFVIKHLKQYLHDWDGDPTKIKKLVDKYAVEDL